MLFRSWNIVTGYLPSANKNMGARELPHDERYELADEYMEVIYKLLEGSWEDSAVILDKATGDFADPSKIHHIGHKGKYFDVSGIHLCENFKPLQRQFASKKDENESKTNFFQRL